MLNDYMTHGTKIKKVIGKCKLWKEWKKGNANKEQYLEEKKEGQEGCLPDQM